MCRAFLFFFFLFPFDSLFGTVTLASRIRAEAPSSQLVIHVHSRLMTNTRCVQSLSTGHDEDEGRNVNGKCATVVRVSRNRKNVMFSCPCSSFVVLCFDCQSSPFEALILFVMNHGERERCRANFVNTCSNCSRSSVRSFRVSAHRLVSII